ncbi:helix-turn-helix domain-containing protein [Acidisoma silvae]|uniref:Helix-turn-helix domain-containing protein n=1 Tax=Acidisoma silvae TaxID=2802396 RepID=A0A963YUA5_9PROT|nr:helix-turn-helix domain-containing protein [Acidisoma silvae]MCB8877031.1 helix-turn-helix domain-containing protein [Acidisoma silvae]
MVRRVEDTSLVKPEERFAYWREFVCRNYVTASAVTEVRDASFSGSLTSQDLGPLLVSELRAPLHLWSRNTKHIQQDDQDAYILSFLSRGRGELNQFGRRSVQHTGDFVLYDVSAVFQYDLDADARLVKIPKSLFDQRITKPRDLVSVTFPLSAPLAPMLSAIITEATRLDLSNPAQALVGARLANSVIDVLVAMCDLFREENSAGAASASLDRTMRYARANLGDRDLGPEILARIGGVSVRSLNRMFGEMSTTPMRWIWKERLHASRNALVMNNVSSVTEAAFSFGFSDLAHFSRSYKSEFGETPRTTLSNRPS